MDFVIYYSYAFVFFDCWNAWHLESIRERNSRRVLTDSLGDG